MKTEKSVIVSSKAQMANLLFPLAILHKSLKRSSSSVHLLTFGPDKNHPLKELEEEVNKISGSFSLYFLDVQPSKDIPAEAWLKFSANYAPHIKIWICRGFSHDEQHIFAKQNLPLISIHKRQDIVSALKAAGHHAWPYLIQADQAWLGESAKKLTKSKQAYRYNMAMIALIQMGATLDSCEVNLLIIEALREMSSGRRSPHIKRLIEWRQQSLTYTLQSITKFRDDFFFFLTAKKRNRPVGFVDLGTIPDCADIKEIVRVGTELYPHLAVAHYIKDGQSCVEYSSAIIELKVDIKPTMTTEAMYMALSQAVLNDPLITIN